MVSQNAQGKFCQLQLFLLFVKNRQIFCTQTCTWCPRPTMHCWQQMDTFSCWSQIYPVFYFWLSGCWEIQALTKISEKVSELHIFTLNKKGYFQEKLARPCIKLLWRPEISEPHQKLLKLNMSLNCSRTNQIIRSPAKRPNQREKTSID